MGTMAKMLADAGIKTANLIVGQVTAEIISLNWKVEGLNNEIKEVSTALAEAKKEEEYYCTHANNDTSDIEFTNRMYKQAREWGANRYELQLWLDRLNTSLVYTRKEIKKLERSIGR